MDPYVRLATQSVECYVKTGRQMEMPDDLPQELYDTQAGAFVSIHEDGQLRGCIGTISPCAPSLASEIISNAISASTRDPRFYPITADELPRLVINVDVLNPAEPCTEADLDPRIYGVIVTKGGRRGLLLPDLEGVDAVQQQLAIAKQKAGLGPHETDVELMRFTVTRHV